MSGPLVVVGDSLLDVDIEGTATRLSPEAPVPVVDAQQMWQRPGGAGLAAVLAARAESDVVLVTALRDDAHGRALARLLAAEGARVMSLPLLGSTVCKMRIRAGGQSVLRMDHGDGMAGRGDLDADIVSVIRTARAICVSDYGRGVATHPGIHTLLAELAGHVPTVWDPHPRGPRPVPSCALVTPNRAEAQQFCGELRPASLRRLRRRWRARALCVTLGAKGALVITEQDQSVHVPVPERVLASVGRSDACGAGDRFAVAAALELGRGADAQRAAAMAVEAAARFVATGGAVGVSTAAALSGPIGPAAEWTASAESTEPRDIDEVRERLRRRGGTLVATGGCFDLLHTGHVRLLRQARQLGDALVVLLNSDSSVRALKGPRRPIVAAADRARVLSALACVDAVCVFDEASPAAALSRLRPDIWVKGNDYTDDDSDLPEGAVVRRYGGEVVLLPTIPGYSSTKLIERSAST